MKKEIVLSPEELYYLGSVIQAKYIDYAYVSAMEDIKQNYPLFESETKASLVSSGILIEDFSGNVEVDGDAMALIKPVFFGETETSADICEFGDKNRVSVHKYHFYDGVITMVTGKGKKLVLTAVDQMMIQDMISSLIPENYSCMAEETVSEIKPESVTRFIAVKRIMVGRSSLVKTYIEADGIMYQDNDGTAESITRDMFISDVYNIVKGE